MGLTVGFPALGGELGEPPPGFVLWAVTIQFYKSTTSLTPTTNHRGTVRLVVSGNEENRPEPSELSAEPVEKAFVVRCAYITDECERVRRRIRRKVELVLGSIVIFRGLCRMLILEMEVT